MFQWATTPTPANARSKPARVPSLLSMASSMRAASSSLGGISPVRSATPISSRLTRGRPTPWPCIRSGSMACDRPYSRSNVWMMSVLRHFSLLSLTVLPSLSMRDATMWTWFSACATTT